jgi:hypothetical protein
MIQRDRLEYLPRTLRYLQQKEPDAVRYVSREVCVLPGREYLGRLSWRFAHPFPLGPDGLAECIMRPANRAVRWFCDSNIFIHHCNPQFWSALLAGHGRLNVASPIMAELRQHWTECASGNEDARDAIRRTLDGDVNSPVRIVDPLIDAEWTRAVEYYVNLVGMRKRAMPPLINRFRKQKGREPTKKELHGFGIKEMGERTEFLARKGATARMPAHRYNDEALVAIAVTDAIYSGREAVILTSDEDVFEEFYKSLWLIDTHYRSMLLAEKYYRDPLFFGPVTKERVSLAPFFDDEVVLVKRSSLSLHEVLSPVSRFVPISCMLIKNGMVYQMTFGAEREMASLLRMKAVTKGRSTDLFDDKNCHVCLGPLQRLVGLVAAIGRDRLIPLNKTDQSFSVVDLNLSVQCGEGVSWSYILDPSWLWLPERFGA